MLESRDAEKFSSLQAFKLQSPAIAVWLKLYIINRWQAFAFSNSELSDFNTAINAAASPFDDCPKLLVAEIVTSEAANSTNSDGV